MDENNLIFEVGSDAVDELSATEKMLVLSTFSNGQETLAGMRVFSLLMKKYKATYKMGRTYERLSEKYEHYKSLYNMYARNVAAGKVGADPDDIDSYDVSRTKWRSQISQ